MDWHLERKKVKLGIWEWLGIRISGICVPKTNKGSNSEKHWIEEGNSEDRINFMSARNNKLFRNLFVHRRMCMYVHTRTQDLRLPTFILYIYFIIKNIKYLFKKVNLKFES